ncbi:SDR family NAD(P)-dependent oxidoreductase [Archangium violaceum]|uniref:SDR family NAD(P)-dependent oxidoreductase n=1 Tax=Archangium violaceum TaxID=83451 RepID=UPI00194E6B7F|nr:SDR family NAD(P)-dependent oxidoreductase [Archangium violaceum]QRO00263.1 SDR family NAD(P)-dependent oxidoreductase [Archangium violaceum]
MSQKLELRGKWTLVTGASSGLGVEIARSIARDHGGNVLVVARRRDRLEALCEELRSRHGVQAACITADLSRPEDVERVFTEATHERDIHAVVFNAGVTYWGEALKLGWSEFQAMLNTNVTSMVRLSTLFMSYLVERGTKGGLMLVSSMASIIPVPYQAAYSGTKAFVTSYGQALAQEVRHTGVSVTVFVPGGISTEMLDRTGLSNRFKAGELGMMTAEQASAHAVRAFIHRRELYVPGLLNQTLALAARMLPRGFLAQRTAALYRPEP